MIESREFARFARSYAPHLRLRDTKEFQRAFFRMVFCFQPWSQWLLQQTLLCTTITCQSIAAVYFRASPSRNDHGVALGSNLHCFRERGVERHVIPSVHSLKREASLQAAELCELDMMNQQRRDGRVFDRNCRTHVMANPVCTPWYMCLCMCVWACMD